MGKPTGFLDYERMDLPERAPARRLLDYDEFHLPLSEKNRRRQGGRCMDCGVPFCQAGIVFDGQRLGCPLHNLIPEWNTLIWEENLEGALHRLLKTNCFPEFTGRVCPAFCERACTCGMIGSPVTVRDNELSIIEYAFQNDLMVPQPPKNRSGKRIAIIGSGPAGLSAAYYLNRRGHSVTVFERDPLPGGLLTYGIPEMKLPYGVVARRIRLMEREGVEFRTGCAVGTSLSAESLARAFDCTIFCCGAQSPRTLSFPETASSGIVYALPYLKAAASRDGKPALSASGKRVLVVGAGDSASDCIATALRQGCVSISQLIRKPALRYGNGSDYAHEEAFSRFQKDIREFETQVSHIKADETGALCGVTTVCGGAEQEREAELLLIASGFTGCEPESVSVYEAMKASGAPVLQAGDMASGASLVVLAIESGKRAAAEADRMLMGYTNL